MVCIQQGLDTSLRNLEHTDYLTRFLIETWPGDPRASIGGGMVLPKHRGAGQTCDEQATAGLVRSTSGSSSAFLAFHFLNLQKELLVVGLGTSPQSRETSGPTRFLTSLSWQGSRREVRAGVKHSRSMNAPCPPRWRASGLLSEVTDRIAR
jgi:hypothetical protein